MSHNNSDGNALSEYGLIGILVLGICIACLSQLGTVINTRFGAFQGSLARENKVQVAVTANMPVIDQPPQALLETISSPITNHSSAIPIGTDPKQAIELIRVSGANGATHELASAIAARAGQFKEEGRITEEQASLLLELANRGHYLGDAQGAIEDAFTQGKDTVTHEGKTYGSLQQLVDRIGFNHAVSIAGISSLEPSSAEQYLKPFAETYQQVQQSGILNDPIVKQQVSELVLQISAMSDAFVWTMGDTLGGGKSTDLYQVRMSVAENFKTNLGDATFSVDLAGKEASTFTHGISVDICATGSGSDKGKRCTTGQ